MSVEEDLLMLFRRTPEVAEMVGTRISLDRRQQKVREPALVITRASGGHDHALNVAGGWARPTVNVTCIADQPTTVNRLRNQVRAAVQGFDGVVGRTKFGSITLDDESSGYLPAIDGSDDGTYLRNLTFQVLHVANHIPAASQESSQEAESQTSTANLKFFVHTDFLADASASVLATRLEQYVEDVNFIFAKNTSRQFRYDPDADFELWDGDAPAQISTDTVFPDGYGYAAYVTKNGGGVSGGGTAYRSSTPGSEVACTGLDWHTIWSAEDVAAQIPVPGSGDTSDQDYYRRQLHALIHELGHGHGLGFSEYYNLASMVDNSGVSPDLSLTAGVGGYWTDRPLVLVDPMYAAPTDAADFLSDSKWSPLSAEIISALAEDTIALSCRSMSMPCLQVPTQDEEVATVTVEVLNANTSAPIDGATVSMYDLTADSGNSPPSETNAVAADSETTDANGQCTFNWGGSDNLHGKQNQARLFKVTKAGFTNNGAWLSVFDLQANVAGTNATNDFRYPDKLTIQLTPS